MPPLQSLSAGMLVLLMDGSLAACGASAPEEQLTAASAAAQPTAKVY
jgi:hypothetical protein